MTGDWKGFTKKGVSEEEKLASSEALAHHVHEAQMEQESSIAATKDAKQELDAFHAFHLIALAPWIFKRCATH